MQLLGLVLIAIVGGTNVDIAEVSKMYMSDLPSPQPLDIDRWMRKWQIRDGQTRRASNLSCRFEVTQYVFVQISLSLTNDDFIDYTFSLSTGL